MRQDLAILIAAIDQEVEGSELNERYLLHVDRCAADGVRRHRRTFSRNRPGDPRFEAARGQALASLLLSAGPGPVACWSTPLNFVAGKKRSSEVVLHRSWVWR